MPKMPRFATNCTLFRAGLDAEKERPISRSPHPNDGYCASAFISAFSLPDKPRPFFGRRAPFPSMTASN